MLLGLLSGIAGFIKVRFLVDKAIIDNIVFRLHYRVTSALFFMFCILCTANSLIGPPIECIYDDKKNEHVINTYCWVMSTFTSRQQEEQNLRLGIHIPHRGVGTSVIDDYDDKRYHKYYQWIPFVLFLQGILFYIPHWFWKHWEGGKVGLISDGLRGVVGASREDRKKVSSRLVQYLVESISYHDMYALGYFVCEVLNFVNVILNFFLTDKLLGGMFLTYGMDAVNFSGDEHHNYAMTKVFPRVTKCTFFKYGPSGTIQSVDSMCVLALNIINEKIYLILWFWFIVLAIVSGLALFYSVAVLLFPHARSVILERRFRFRADYGADKLVEKTTVGDFLLLHLLGQNINSVLFGDILNDMSQELSVEPKQSFPGNIEMNPMHSIYPSKKLMAD